MNDDLDTLARTIYGEARGEPMSGKVAVAHVVMNRAKKQSWYGKTIKGVCLHPFQFSCWNANDPNLPKLQAVTLDDKAFRLCMFAAIAAIDGLIPDPTSRSTHYHAVKVKPDWAVGKEPVCTIGVHKFYNDVE